MQQFFDTIQESVTEELIEKKSRFIANVFPVQTEEEASQKLEEIKRREREARHHVYAFRLENGLEKYSDDGEPSGTAGMPILDLIRGNRLVNVMVVVTRYFGGILLGTGGLVRSYGGVAKMALEKWQQIRGFFTVKVLFFSNYLVYKVVSVAKFHPLNYSLSVCILLLGTYANSFIK